MTITITVEHGARVYSKQTYVDDDAEDFLAATNTAWALAVKAAKRTAARELGIYSDGAPEKMWEAEHARFLRELNEEVTA